MVEERGREDVQFFIKKETSGVTPKVSFFPKRKCTTMIVYYGSRLKNRKVLRPPYRSGYVDCT